MNQIISQLHLLVKEATQEEQQRQTLKKTVTQLRAYLADIESQLEARCFCFKRLTETSLLTGTGMVPNNGDHGN